MTGTLPSRSVETWDAIRARRNVREFDDRPIPEEHLERILDAGRRTPSSRNWQPWDFVLVTDRAELAELAKVWRYADHVARAPAAVAQVGPVVEDESERHWLWFDHGQAAMSIAIAAADLGIGSSHAAVADQDLARRLLGYPPEHFTLALLSLGYPRDRPLRPIRRPNRRPLDEVVHRGRW
jgi:nitroreductase